MKTLLGCGAIAAFAALGLANDAAAQQQPGPLGVVEIFACNFVGASDMEDLLSVAERWNDCADDRDVTDYTAFILTPYLFSDDVTFEVGWLGAYPNGAAMGAGQAQWLTEGTDLAADFEEVVDCDSHSQFAAANIRMPPGGPPEAGGLLGFRNCTLHEGRIAQEVGPAIAQWGNYLAENGHDGFDGMLFPVAGERPDATYHFKTVHGFSSPVAYGEFMDIVTGGGLQVAQNLFGRLMDCDSPRIYAMTNVRVSAQP